MLTGNQSINTNKQFFKALLELFGSVRGLEIIANSNILASLSSISLISSGAGEDQILNDIYNFSGVMQFCHIGNNGLFASGCKVYVEGVPV